MDAPIAIGVVICEAKKNSTSARQEEVCRDRGGSNQSGRVLDGSGRRQKRRLMTGKERGGQHSDGRGCVMQQVDNSGRRGDCIVRATVAEMISGLLDLVSAPGKAVWWYIALMWQCSIAGIAYLSGTHRPRTFDSQELELHHGAVAWNRTSHCRLCRIPIQEVPFGGNAAFVGAIEFVII